MKRLIAFIILVILVIVMIVLSYNFYSRNNTVKKAKNKLDNQLTITERKAKDKDSSSTSSSTTNNTNEEKKTTEESTNQVDENVVDEANVPDTDSNDNDGYIKIDHYTVSVDNSTLKVGETSNIHIKIYPVNASEREVVYVSSDDSIVKVDSFGKMTALSKGEVRITVKVKNTNEYSFLINVK